MMGSYDLLIKKSFWAGCGESCKKEDLEEGGVYRSEDRRLARQTVERLSSHIRCLQSCMEEHSRRGYTRDHPE